MTAPASPKVTYNESNLAKQREKVQDRVMARKTRKQENQQQKATSKPSLRDQCLKDDDTDSGASMLNLGASKKKKGHQPPKRNRKAKKSKTYQVFDLVMANAKGKDGDADDFYYEIHYENAIKRCNAYWQDKDYENLEQREAWERHNEKLEKDNKPTIWDPLREAQIRDTEDFWRGESRDDVLSDSNTARWKAENKRRAAAGERPLDRDRVRPWSEFPMYVPYDHMGDSPPLGVALGKSVSKDPRLDDREIRFARTRRAEFSLPPDVDAVPLLRALEEDWKIEKGATDAPGKSADLGRLDHEIFQADAPKKTNSSNANFAAIMTAFANQIPNADKPHGSGKAKGPTSSIKTSAQIRSVNETPKPTDDQIELFTSIAGEESRPYAALYLEHNACINENAVMHYYEDQEKPAGQRITAQQVDDKMDVDDKAFGIIGGKNNVWNETNASVGNSGKGGQNESWTRYDDEKAEKK